MYIINDPSYISYLTIQTLRGGARSTKRKDSVNEKCINWLKPIAAYFLITNILFLSITKLSDPNLVFKTLRRKFTQYRVQHA